MTSSRSSRLEASKVRFFFNGHMSHICIIYVPLLMDIRYTPFSDILFFDGLVLRYILCFWRVLWGNDDQRPPS